jgi:hypothetical protein
MTDSDQLSWPRDATQICSLVEGNKATLKIVAKMKDESYFAEKWILHHLKIAGDSNVIIIDNMSTESEVFAVYEKYKRRILLIAYDDYMDFVHMSNVFMQFYRSLAASSSFFTIIDADEYLYWWDGAKAVSDESMLAFLDGKRDVSFFAPLWLANVGDNEKMLQFTPKDLWFVHMGKPIVSPRIIPALESAALQYKCPALHHTKDLPVEMYGNAPGAFFLAHLKNVNKYHRIKSNMQKLAALGVVKHQNDYRSLLTVRAELIEVGYVRGYIEETRKLTEMILCGEAANGDLHNVIEFVDGGGLKFYPEGLAHVFEDIIRMDYFQLLRFDLEVAAANHCTTFESYRRLRLG